MSDWHHGYVTDLPYTHGFYREFRRPIRRCASCTRICCSTRVSGAMFSCAGGRRCGRESAQRLGACPIARLQDPGAASLAFATSAGEVSGRAELYRPLLQALAKGPRPLADLLPAVPGLTLPGALEAVSRLLQSGVVGLHVPEANQKPATRANRAPAAAVAQGAPYGFAAAPGIGSGVALTDVQWLALDAQAQGAHTLAALAAGVEARLQRLNRALVKDGQPLPYGEATQAELTARLADVPTRILPLLRRLGGGA